MGRPDPIRDEVPVAFVVSAPGSDAPTVEELEAWCTERGIAKVTELIGAMIEEPRADTYEAAAMSI